MSQFLRKSPNLRPFRGYPWRRLRLRLSATLCCVAVLLPVAAMASTQAPQPGESRWQATGIGLFLGGAAGFAIGSHLDRRTPPSGNSPAESAASLMLGGLLAGTLGGYVWGKEAVVDEGRLAWSASAFVWTAVLTATTRASMGLVEDARSPLIVGGLSALVMWHTWDDWRLGRVASWVFDGVAVLGFLGSAAISEELRPPFPLDGNQEDFDAASQSQAAWITGLFAGVLVTTGAVLWAVAEPIPVRGAAAARRWQLAPMWGGEGPSGIVLSTGF